ncbi:30S ribosomal protein S8 [Acetomicrobium hydrogeniformans]|uniref:Small ribosomal subunit protein uS8 n=1 Tax=Acetomicrobium hydrogeniformans TaxID=649746 RepID=A0A7V6ZCR7_9BACT|nr:30S ribosomal protein S8 [Acetomicrobium hydrogeniformans]HHZ03563.1 30S ribosomal protein S8 [Acetomicrobium hydrogeniformans]
MYVTDPIADMLTRIRNANIAYHEVVDIPMSNMKHRIARVLKDEGYIKNYKVINDPGKPYQILRIYLHYGPNKERVIQGLRRVSKPGRRIYVNSRDLPKVMGGLGVAIISTSSGLMTDAEARKKGLGGEVLCYVW